MNIQTGHCKLNGMAAFIRKITEAGVVCFFIGRNVHEVRGGQNCMKMDEFTKKFKYEK